MTKKIQSLKMKLCLFLMILFANAHLQINAQAPNCNGGTIYNPGASTICQGATPSTIIDGISVWPTSLYLFWQFDNGNGWQPISGASSASYSPGPLTTTTSFRRMAASPTVGCTVYSNVITITVVTAGSIGTYTPTSCPNGTVQLYESVSGTGGTYRWEIFIPSYNGWVDQGVTTPYFNRNITGLSLPIQFRRVVNGSGCTAYSNIVTINPVTVSAGAIDTNTPIICSNQTAQLISTVEGSGGAYRWETYIPGYNGWVDQGVTTSSFSTSSNLFSPTSQFRRALVPICGGATIYSNVVNITVNVAPVAGSIFTYTNPICASSGTAVLISNVSGSGGTYQWQSRGNYSAFADIPGATSMIYSATGITYAKCDFRRAVVSALCGRAYSNDIYIQINSCREEQTQNEEVLEGINDGYSLEQNAPNPAELFTVINYNIPATAKEANLVIRDVYKGSELSKHILTERKGSVRINTADMSPGMYLYSLIVNGKALKTRKMLVVK